MDYRTGNIHSGALTAKKLHHVSLGYSLREISSSMRDFIVLVFNFEVFHIKFSKKIKSLKKKKKKKIAVQSNPFNEVPKDLVSSLFSVQLFNQKKKKKSFGTSQYNYYFNCWRSELYCNEIFWTFTQVNILGFVKITIFSFFLFNLSVSINIEIQNLIYIYISILRK